jgi:hypothetical protein
MKPDKLAGVYAAIITSAFTAIGGNAQAATTTYSATATTGFRPGGERIVVTVSTALPDFATGQVTGFGVVFNANFTSDASVIISGNSTSFVLTNVGSPAPNIWWTSDSAAIAIFEEQSPPVIGLVLAMNNISPATTLGGATASAVTGFRVDSIPEPSAALLGTLGLVLLGRRRRA